MGVILTTYIQRDDPTQVTPDETFQLGGPPLSVMVIQVLRLVFGNGVVGLLWVVVSSLYKWVTGVVTPMK